MSSVLSNYLGNQALSLYRKPWLALHAAAPDPTGVPANEVAGGGYGRQLMPMTSASNKSYANSGAVQFHGLPDVRITDLAAWTKQTAGDLLWIVHLTTPINVPQSGVLAVAAYDIAVVL